MTTVSPVVQNTRAKVAQQFTDKLYDQRDTNLAAFQIDRHISQHGPNLDADSTPLYDLVAPHVESFNWMLQEGLGMAVNNLAPVVIRRNAGMPEDFPTIRFRITDVRIPKPCFGGGSEPLLPHQARELGLTYDAPMYVHIERQVGDAPAQTFEYCAGRVPIMVRTHKCHLDGLSRRQMVQAKEEAGEWGGYFIMNGNERLVRLLVMPRRNFIMAMSRSSFLNRGPEFTKFATSIRCVRKDQSAITINAHYLETGSIKVRFVSRKQEFFIPAVLILKALTGMSDREIYEKVTLNHRDTAFEAERTEMMLRQAKELQLYSRNEALAYLGQHFRGFLRLDQHLSDARCGLQLLDDYLFIHIQDFDSASPDTSSQRHASSRSTTTTTDSSEIIISPHHDAIYRAKADLLILMIRKLFALVQDKIKPDNVDALSAHECLLPGHLYNIFVKEQLSDLLLAMRGQIFSILRSQPDKFQPHNDNFWRDRIFNRMPDIGRNLRYFLVTGNLRSRSGLDLMQVSGYTVNAEKLNYWRYLSHFRAIHRGQFFTTMKTTAVRKLLPESWGFVCPAHTPDGSPCGLLNHLSHSCQLLTHNSSTNQRELVAALFAIGMSDITNDTSRIDDLPVLLDGVYVGKISRVESKKFAATIRYLKVTGHQSFDKYLEIMCIEDYSDRMWPHISLATNTARFMRPVYYLPPASPALHNQLAASAAQAPNPEGSNYIAQPLQEPKVEYIGAWEQLNMEIACLPEDYNPELTTHQEISPSNMLSVLASLTPFSDHNQSPRNMYQCQMGKQTMSTPYHSHPYRIDNKVYRVQNPQTPIVRNEAPYRKYLFDEYPHGCNAVVAVISYTGYDMEDAFILNKSAYERGFGHGSVYKYKVMDLSEKKMRGENQIHHHFNNRKPQGTLAADGSPAVHVSQLDVDGLPTVGQYIKPEEPLYCVYNDISHTFKPEMYKDTEPCYIEEIRALNNTTNSSAEGNGAGDATPEIQKVALKLRMNRNPVIGDKFSSRHGQKGVLSNLFPQVDMPWSESGIAPDVIINPHAFPSRMTIGMLIESMAGKAGALHGKFQDGTPFQFDENNRAVDYFGQQLRAAGYNYMGSEPLYSGVTGEPLMADIFFGVVYYQRLRHMVKDKFQARSTGPINSIHRQPIKGRKVHGGIRFGEMERDSLIAHGTSYLLHDRLMMCSDYHTTYACRECGSLIAAQGKSKQWLKEQAEINAKAAANTQPGGFERGADGQVKYFTNAIAAKDAAANVHCRICGHGNGICVVAVPYVFMYLVNELAAINIRLTLDIK